MTGSLEYGGYSGGWGCEQSSRPGFDYRGLGRSDVAEQPFRWLGGGALGGPANDSPMTISGQSTYRGVQTDSQLNSLYIVVNLMHGLSSCGPPASFSADVSTAYSAVREKFILKRPNALGCQHNEIRILVTASSSMITAASHKFALNCVHLSLSVLLIFPAIRGKYSHHLARIPESPGPNAIKPYIGASLRPLDLSPPATSPC